MAEPDPTPGRFQFTMRTLFVMVTVVAVLAGVARIAVGHFSGVVFAAGLATFVVGLLLLADQEEKKRSAGILLGCLFLVLGVIAILVSMLPIVE